MNEHDDDNEDDILVGKNAAISGSVSGFLSRG